MSSKEFISSIGARTLSEEEIRKVLPTYDTMFQQIEDLRKQAGEFHENQQVSKVAIVQKTNSFGILGKRGTGKTSILHTIRKRLQNENPQDILLPLLVPDNMAPESDIMGAILGSFLRIVKNLENEMEQLHFHGKRIDGYYDESNCRFTKQNELRNVYNQLCKMYCYVQPEYRQILIRNYTDLPSYITKSSEVLNGDSQFNEELDRFICKLIITEKKRYCAEHPEEKEVKTPLIHIFIDDIDLSPERSSEIAKIILAYLSHRAIIIHISGDIETFEEALTMSFFKDENGHLNSGYLEHKILRDKKLIDRKRELSYEYLKKIIPPTYRQYLNYWNIYSRGNYRISNTIKTKNEILVKEEIQEKVINPSLSELLVDVFKEYNITGLFLLNGRGTKNEEQNQILPLTYHIFDETSRGLNNVYSLLLNEYMRNKKEEESHIDTLQKVKIIDYTFKKKFIEVVISSNPMLNKYQELLNSIICWGEKEETMWIRSDNLLNYFKKVILNVSNDGDKLFSLKKDIDNETVLECFSLFVLVYLASRLFPFCKCEKNTIRELNILVVLLLISKPIIMGSTVNLEYDNLIIYNNIINIKKNKGENLDSIELSTSQSINKLWFINKLLVEQDTDFTFMYYCILISELGHYDVYNEEKNIAPYLVSMGNILKRLSELCENDLELWYRENNEILNIIYSITNYDVENKVYNDIFGDICSGEKQNIEQLMEAIYTNLYNREKSILFYNKNNYKDGYYIINGTSYVIKEKAFDTVKLGEAPLRNKDTLYIKCPRSNTNDFISASADYIKSLIVFAQSIGLRNSVDLKICPIDNCRENIHNEIQKFRDSFNSDMNYTISDKDESIILKILNECHEKENWNDEWMKIIIEKSIGKLQDLLKKYWNITHNIPKFKIVNMKSICDFVDIYSKVNNSTIAHKTAVAIAKILKDEYELLQKPENFIQVYVLLYQLTINNRVTYGKFQAKEALKSMVNVGFEFDKEYEGYYQIQLYALYYIDYLLHTNSEMISASIQTAEMLQNINMDINRNQEKYQNNMISDIKKLVGDEFTDEDISILLGE